MPRAYIDLEPWMDEITDMITEGRTHPEIRQWLRQNQGVQVGKSVFKERLRDRGITSILSQKRRLKTDPAFIAFIEQAVSTSYQSDEEIAATLFRTQRFPGASARLIRRVREAHGWRRRDRDIDQRQARFDQTKQVIFETIRSGVGRAWGRAHFTAYLQQEHPYLHARDDHVQRALREINEQFRLNRKPTFQLKRRNQAIYEGPDHVWSVDGHEKFSQFGIEIYAAIDCYSRRILWTYVGISSRKQVSVAKQYISTVRHYNIVPARIRSDRGSETPFMADMQFCFYLQWLKDTGQLPDNRVLTDPDIDRLFRQSFVFGTSIRNIRIESFWSRILKHQLGPWLVGESVFPY
jgi:hypothetical protein